jgi:hypothetical protein
VAVLEEGSLPVTDRFAVGAGLLGLLAMAAENASLLAVVDDAHWLDRPILVTVPTRGHRDEAQHERSRGR